MSCAVNMIQLVEIWEQIEHFIPADDRAITAKILIEQFRDNDASDYSNLEDNEVLHAAIKEILNDEGSEDQEDPDEDGSYE